MAGVEYDKGFPPLGMTLIRSRDRGNALSARPGMSPPEENRGGCSKKEAPAQLRHDGQQHCPVIHAD